MDEESLIGNHLSASDRAWLKHLLGSESGTAIIVVDSAGAIVRWLGAAERHFGYTREEALGLDFATLFTPEDRELGLDRQEMAVAVASSRSEDDRWHVRKDGSRFWAAGVLEAVWEPDGTLSSFCKVFRDRTDFRTQLESFKNQVASLEGDSVRRGEALFSLAHEFRNALGPVQNAIDALQLTREEGAPSSKQLPILHRQLTGITTLVEDLAEYAHATLRAPRLNKERLAVRDALGYAADSISLVVARARQTLIVTVPDIPFWVDADPERLQQILFNLLLNASKYTPDGGHIHLTATVEGNDAVIRVIDDGIGIPTQVLPYIFDLFTRGDCSGFAEGQGIGLAVVKELAALHGGGVDARSEGEGLGSVFALRLPLSTADPC